MERLVVEKQALEAESKRYEEERTQREETLERQRTRIEELTQEIARFAHENLQERSQSSKTLERGSDLLKEVQALEREKFTLEK